MLLGLSSAAAPHADIDALIAACEHRGIDALELREGDAHGLSPETIGSASGDLTSISNLRATILKVVAYEIGVLPHAAPETRVRELAAMGGALGTMLLAGTRTSSDVRGRLAAAARLREAGVDVGVVVRGETAVCEAEQVRAAGFPMVWEADASCEPVGRRGRELLRTHASELRYVRILGSGPEAEVHTGSGIGELFGLLARDGYDGAIVLAPSTSAYRTAWDRWLGRRAWGCGGQGGGAALVGLSTTRKEHR